MSVVLLEDALMGIKDLILNHPAELRLHRYAVIEKLRERISDDDKVVREALYQLFKSEIFPGCAKVFFFPFCLFALNFKLVFTFKVKFSMIVYCYMLILFGRNSGDADIFML